MLAADLATGKTSSRELVEQCLARIEEADGQGASAFVSIDRDGTRVAADAMDRLRAAAVEPSDFAGIPISIKDLFDIRGQPTRAGSIVIDEQPAARDALAVERLRRAGFVLIGRTNMTEFAFSGLGLNPHFGTPLSPWNRPDGHVSGGSTSGGAVSVADGMAHAALGTDTGGSCRIPAAWCGLVGFKPTQARVPRDGTVPLSSSLDSIGSIGRSVACCAAIDGMISDEALPVARLDVAGLRLLAPTNYVLDDMDDMVANAYAEAFARLRRAGVQIDEVTLPPLDDIPAMNAKGGFAAAEAYAWHRHLLATAGSKYDPRVRTRIERGGSQDAADYIALTAARVRLIGAIESATAGYDAIVMPTTPILPPRLAELADGSDYGRLNLLALRNPTIANLIDGCALSLPLTRFGDTPVGMTLMATTGDDARLLSICLTIEAQLLAGIQ